MIVRCPECSTGFKLPADRVGPKGAKVRCTKCDHVFRVRITDGEPEIFYKPGEEPAKSQPAFSEFGNRTAFGGPNSFAEDDEDLRESGAHTAIGRPGDINNIRSTPRKPLSAVSPNEDSEESTDRTQRAGPLAAAGVVNKQMAGIVNKKKIAKADEDEGFSGPGAAISEPEDDSTSIGKPVEDGYTPKATSFGLPAIGDNDEPPSEEISDPEDAATNFGLPGRDKDDGAPVFGEPDEEDDDLRGTAFGRPAFQEAEDVNDEAEEPQFGENPKGTLFGLPAVGGDEDDEAQPAGDEDEIDLFEDDQEPAQTQVDSFDDPFAGAFEDQISDGPGIEVDPSLKKDDDEFAFDDTALAGPPGFGGDEDSFADAFAADQAADEEPEDIFGGGGGGSDFGDASELVDPSFGEGAPSFDPNASDDEDYDDFGSEADAFGGGTDDEFEFNTGPAEDVDLVMETEPPPAAERERAKAAKAAKKAAKKAKKGPRAAVPAAAGTAPDGAGAVQKFMNLLLIVLLVIIGFVGFAASKTGGVVDFGRVDHMLGIVFEGKPFEPRPEWGLEKRTADDIVPLQTAQVVAYPSVAADGEPLIVSGKVENKGTSTFSGVKISVALVGPEGAILTEKTVPAGTRLEPRKLKTLKVVKSHDAIVRQMSTMEPNSELPFVAIFEEMPTNSMEELEVLVDVAEKTEVGSKPADDGAEEEASEDAEQEPTEEDSE